MPINPPGEVRGGPSGNQRKCIIAVSETPPDPEVTYEAEDLQDETAKPGRDSSKGLVRLNISNKAAASDAMIVAKMRN
ncbi:hypothetical protein ACO22_05211 [Paracoccidioides brasiliensis]|uniref:Uncharacterized protein n=1 Tax=Paracoccidioides brasiliensis TaxID=121759 RepID=A0A1D2JB35_PARBR|nr:hypothetical protein ACO22_05211 [Paracoccidioides brasiliensis]